MSDAGQLRRFDRVQLTSDLTSQADIIADRRHVSKVPMSDIGVTLPIAALRTRRPLFFGRQSKWTLTTPPSASCAKANWAT